MVNSFGLLSAMKGPGSVFYLSSDLPPKIAKYNLDNKQYLPNQNAYSYLSEIGTCN